MSDQSAIEWTDATWNPVTGCDRVSPGCKNCYALDLAARLKRMGQPRYQRDGQPPTSGPGFGVTLHEDVVKKPLRWRKPRRVFVNSMSDLFHPKIPEDFINDVFHVMELASEHTFQVLTKRPERMRDYTQHRYGYLLECPPPRNIWLGTSIELATYNERADHLRECDAAIRFISAEPLLGPLDGLDLAGIDWLIVGGESGVSHRPVNAEWVRDLRDAARSSNTAFFFKQWGGRTSKAGGRELDGRIWNEWPGLGAAAA